MKSQTGSLETKKLNQKVISVHTMCVVALLGALFLTGCGSGKVADGSSSTTSTVASTDTTTTTTTTTLSTSSKVIAKCNRLQGDTLDVSVRVDPLATTATDGLTLQAKLLALASEIDSTNKYAIFFYKGKLQGSSTSSTDQVLKFDSSPVRVSFNSSTGSSLGVTYDRLSYEKLNSVRLSIGGYSSTMDQVLESVSMNILLNDTAHTYKVLRVGLYKKNTSTLQFDAVRYEDILIPSFYANPDDYAVDPSTGYERAQVLKDLHPFKGVTSDFSRLAAQLCVGF